MRNPTGPILLLALLAGCDQPAGAPPAAPAPAAPTAPVTVVAPQRQSLGRVVEQPGAIQAFEETLLYARVPGYIQKVHVDIGAQVRGPKFDAQGEEIEAGQVLALIAVPEMEEEVHQKKALTQQALADVDQTEKALAAAEAHIATAEAQVAEAKALHDRWESESKRMVELVRSGVIDAQARDETLNQFKAASARVLTSAALVNKAKADRDKSKADVRSAQARVAVAEANEKCLAALLAYAKVRTPFDGIVTRRKVNTGDLIQPHGGKGDLLFAVARLDPVRIVVSVPEADAALIRDGAETKLNVPALGSAQISGKISRTSWSLEPGARTLRAEVDLPNQDGRLRPGMYVYARIQSKLPEAWVLPSAAIVKQGDLKVCFLAESGKAVRTPVQVGRSDDQFTEVVKRQQPGTTAWVDWTGQEAVASPALGLSDGQTLP